MSTARPARTEAPILLSGPLVPKVIDGSKSMTRRLAGLAAVNEHPDSWTFDRWQAGYPDGRRRAVFTSEDGEPVGIVCPYDVPKLWVQETYRLDHANGLAHAVEQAERRKEGLEVLCIYAAGNSTARVSLAAAEVQLLRARKSPPTQQQPGRFMYRSCSRITIPTTTIRVERLHAITDNDIIAEGVRIPVAEETGRTLLRMTGKHPPIDFLRPGGSLPVNRWTSSEMLRAHWASLWSEVNGRESWKANPWVWVVGWHPPTVEVRR